MNMIFIHAVLQCHSFCNILLHRDTILRDNSHESAPVGSTCSENMFVSSEACLESRKKIPCAVLNITCNNQI